jgi:hypothetical protein
MHILMGNDIVLQEAHGSTIQFHGCTEAKIPGRSSYLELNGEHPNSDTPEVLQFQNYNVLMRE